MARAQTQSEMFSDQQKDLAENQIREQMRIVEYQVREYPVEVLVEKFLKGEDIGQNEVFIPDYQRDFVWSQKQQSRFIESVMIGLPIPYLFVADTGAEDEDFAGRLEVIDGTQRLRSLAAYLHDRLSLVDLEKLPSLNGTVFSDLLPSRRRRFNRITIRLIELTEKADEEMRRDMFDRLNTGGTYLNPMEKRRGTRRGPLLKFVEELAKEERFRDLVPLSEASEKRKDREELVARFFAYLDMYLEFKHSVSEFIDQYFDQIQSDFDAERQNNMQYEWYRMLDFVEQKFPFGFRRDSNKNRTPRVRFEAIAVGVALALREVPDLNPPREKVAEWADSEEFDNLVSSDGANSNPRVRKRIEYVRDKLMAVA